MTLDVFAFFHLNLMFSSIPEERRPEIIERAYWPLLDLPRRIGAPIGVELTGLTIEIANAIAPDWVSALAARIDEGVIELVGSGYAQIIGPLTPAHVNRRNLSEGMRVYDRFLNRRPKLALVNEQAFSAGMIPLYADEGFESLLMDWDNLAPFHPDWPAETRFSAQRVKSPSGRMIGLMWTQTLAFQRLQRLAHGELTLDQYLRTIMGFVAPTPRILCVYSNDAEVFGVRPNRMHTEDVVQDGEWDRIAGAWAALATTPGVRFLSPAQAYAAHPPKGIPLTLETPENPIPVKKQPKYNIARWAVTGRGSLDVNASCERLFSKFAKDATATEADWRALLESYSSDYRTHITEERWRAFCDRLNRLEQVWDAGAEATPAPHPNSESSASGPWLDMETPSLAIRLNTRRGLAIDSMGRSGDPRPPMLVSLLHGHFHDIALQYDWYTGNAVFEAPGESKVADLERTSPRLWTCAKSGARCVETIIYTRRGPIFKRWTFDAKLPRATCDMVFHWPDPVRGTLRVGHILLNPNAFEWPDIVLETENGGPERDRYEIGRSDYDHGAAVSLLVSATNGLGATDGSIRVHDGRRGFSIEIDRKIAPLLVMVQHKSTTNGPFCRIALSAEEVDDTRRVAPGPAPPRQIRYAIVLD